MTHSRTSRMGSGRSSRRGFSLIECGALVLIMSMIGMTVAPALNKARSEMRGAGSASNLMQIGQGAGLYGFSNGGRMFSYSWRAGQTYLLPDGRTKQPGDDVEAAAYQNQEILQRRTGRVSGAEKIGSSVSRLAHRRFNHLVLLDFLDVAFED